MKLFDTLALLRAGYTKAEIQELETAQENEPVESSSLTGDSSQDPSGSVPSPEDPVENANKKEINELRNLVTNLTNLIQKQNIQNSELKPAEKESAVDILATIINPKRE